MRLTAKIFLLVAVLCITAGAVWAAPEDDSGTGWIYTSSDNKLVILGKDAISCTSWRNSDKFKRGDVKTIALNDYKGTIIPDMSFEGCTVIETVTIPATVTSIGSRAFADCSELKTVYFENDSKLTAIGSRAFKDCAKLDSITLKLPETLTTIGESAFEGTGFKSIIIPANVTTLGTSVFNGCKNLTTVTFTGVSKLAAIPATAFYDCESFSSITIPASVDVIGASAFANTAVKHIDVPSGVTKIDTKAFDVKNPENLTVSFAGNKAPVFGKDAVPSNSTISLQADSDPDEWGAAFAGGGITSGVTLGSDTTQSFAVKLDNVGTGAGFDESTSIGKWMKVGGTAKINAGTRGSDQFKNWVLPSCIEFAASVSTDVSPMIRLIDSADAIITAVWKTVTPDYPVKVVSSPANAGTVLINNVVRDSLASTDVKAGDNVSVDITPHSGFTFSHWTAEGIDVSAVSTDKSIAFEQPAGGVELTAHFSGAGSYILTLNSVGTDASIKHGVNTQTGTASLWSNVAYSDDVTVDAGTRSMSGISYSFKEWQVASEAEVTFSPDARSSIAQFKMPSANVILTASWRQNKLYNTSITDSAGANRTWRNGDGDLLIHINTDLSKFDHLITVDDYPLIETVDYTVASGTVITIDSGYLSSSALSAGSHLIRVMFNDGTADINLTKNTKSSGGGGCSAGFGGLAALALGGLVMIFRRKQA